MMDWLYYTPDTATSPGSLGYYVGDKFRMSTDAAETLEAMNVRLAGEDRMLRTYRRSLGFSQTITKEVVPILTEHKENTKEFLAAVKLMANYTTPLECLLATDELAQTAEGQQTLYELQQHMSEAKNIFLEVKVAKNVMEVMDDMLGKIKAQHLSIKRKAMSKSAEDSGEESGYQTGNSNGKTFDLTQLDSDSSKQQHQQLSDAELEAMDSECGAVLSCVTLLRNALHMQADMVSGGSSPISEDSSSATSSSSKPSIRQKQILWNFFAANLDSTIINMISNPCLSQWCMQVMQLIALIYKDQHVSDLQQMLAVWLAMEISDSSEDNESNTSPQDQNGSCSSPILTSNETDDSENGNGNGNGSLSKNGGGADENEADESSSSSSETHVATGSKSKKQKKTKLIKETGDREQSTVVDDLRTELAAQLVTGLTLATTMATYSSNNAEGAAPSSTASTGAAPRNGVKHSKLSSWTTPLQTDALSDNSDEPPVKKTKMALINEDDGLAKKKMETGSPRKKKISRESSPSKRPNPNSTSDCSKGSDSSSDPLKKARMTTTSGVSSATDRTPENQFLGGLCSSETMSSSAEENDKMKQVASANSLSSGDIMTNVASGTPDYGYSSEQQNQLEQPEVVSSTSSNEEREALQEQRKRTPHTNLQKPRPNKKPTISPAERRELKRKMLMMRAKKQRIKVKALVHHVPTEQDITDLLKEFTVDFLLKGYAPLVNGLRLQLLADNDQHMDKSHYLWLLAYFLKFATQLEIEMEHIEPVLSIGTISYLTYEGVRFFEDLELACRQRTVDLKPHLRRMHLVTTAIHEFVLTLCTYLEFTYLSEETMDKLRELQAACYSFKELRQLFLLLIRRFKPNVQSRQFLNDVICGNHDILVMLERVNTDPEFMISHLKQFASIDIMRHYGYLLESFRTNPEQLNDALFTMMHHVAGDLKRPEALYVPHILKAFSDMWEEGGDVKICDDWTDLIAYVIRKFIATMGDRPHACAANLLDCLNSADTIDENGFSKTQLENLYWYYSQCEHAEDPVGGIIEMYKATHSITKTRLSVIQALLSQGIITHAQYMGLMYMKSVLTSKTSHEGSVVAEAGSEHEHCDSDGHDTDNEHSEVNSRSGNVRDQVEVLKDLLKKQGKGYLIDWLKQILLDTCHVKLKGTNIQTSEGITLEPIPFHFNYMKQSIPLVPWNKQQEAGLQTEAFILLLHKLGFHLAADVGKCFPRIPHFWSADHILQLAQKLGHINPNSVGFDISSMLMDIDNNQSSSEAPSPLPTAAVSDFNVAMTPPRTPGGDTSPSWTAQSSAVPSLCSPPPPAPPPQPPTSASGNGNGNGSPPSSDLPPLTLFPDASGNNQTSTSSGFLPDSSFAIPTPTVSWLQMAMMSKRLPTSTNSTPATSNYSSPALTPAPSCQSLSLMDDEDD